MLWRLSVQLVNFVDHGGFVSAFLIRRNALCWLGVGVGAMAMCSVITVNT